MATPRISMRKIKDVLRLKHAAGFSQRQIARSLNLSTGAVSTYLTRAAVAGLSWPLPEGLSEAELARALFPCPPAEAPRRWAEPDFATVHQELSRKGVTLQVLWEEYCAAQPHASYSYSQFCARYREWRSRLKLSLRQVHKAGEKLFVDYCGPTVPVIDPLTGSV